MVAKVADRTEIELPSHCHANSQHGVWWHKEMQPADLLLIIMLTALTLYAICGGADFGVGVWEFSTALQATDKERGHLYKAIGPVWEANHVWLIFVVVILFNGFPGVFAALSRALWLPLLIALCGI